MERTVIHDSTLPSLEFVFVQLAEENMELNVKGPAVIHADSQSAVPTQSEDMPLTSNAGLLVCFWKSYVHLPRSRSPRTLG